MKQLFAVMLKEIRHLKRDKFMLRMLIIAPVMQLLILGYAVTFEVKNVNIMICDLDNSTYSRQFIQKIITNDRFHVVGYTRNIQTLDNELRRWNAKVGLYIPPDFSQKLIKKNNASILAYLDAVDGNQALTAFGYLQKIAVEQSLQLLPIGNIIQLRKKQANVQLNTHFLFNPDLRNDAYMIPGVVILLLTIITTFVGALTLVKEKEIGTLEHIMVTPIKRHQLIFGKLLPYLIYAFIEMAVILKLAELVFDLTMVGSFATLYLLAAAFLFTTTGLGLLVSTIAGTQQQALFLAWFFMVFSMLLSGFFIPIANMPEWLQLITYLNPMRYMMTGVREIFIKGTPTAYLLDQLIPMVILGGILFLASVVRFQKKLS